jgi:hypothetical protein
MTEQEIKAMLDQIKALDLFSQIPGYNELPKLNKEAVLEAFQMSINNEKAKLASGK